MKLEELVEDRSEEQVLLENQKDILQEAEAGEWSSPVTADVLFEELGI